MQAWAEDERRFRELILYVGQKCAHHRKFGAVKLNKVLFYADFLAYALLGNPITGFEYQKLKKGPAPRRMAQIRAQMEALGEIAIQKVQTVAGQQHRVRPLRKPNLSLFSQRELELVDRIIDTLKDKDAEQVSDLTHLDVGWKAAQMNETIPYGTVFLSDKQLTPSQIRRIKKFAMEHGYGAK